MLIRLLPVLALLALAGCVAHEKAGDSAAATGDWKTAYTHYRQALSEKPDTPGLKEKRDAARREALSQAWQRARGCEQQGDWTCAMGESEYMLSIEPNHPDALGMKNAASARVAMARIADARAAARQLKYKEALSLLQSARTLSNDPN